MNHLTVCAAGAGSGKTYSICEKITDDIVGGLDPSRIVATTFTKKAAAELKHRIQARLLKENRLPVHERVALSERLELALVGTVDSVAHKLLRRYALDLGMSPRLDILDDDAEPRVLARILQEMDPEPWGRLAILGRKFGGSDAQRTALRLLHLKRGNRISDADFNAQLLASAKRTSEVLAPNGPDPHAPDARRFYDEIQRALERLNAIKDDTATTKTTIQALSRMARLHTGEWQEFARCSKIEAGKKSGANAALDDLRAFAGQVRGMKALHDDVHTYLALIASQTLALSTDYDAYKQARGLLDFTDLEAKLLDLLERPEVVADLRETISLVVVDEFQDTNPIQLAIFLRLREIAPKSYWVGDEKQAIYGFRGSDADLMRAVWARVPENRERLPNSFRSQEGLVHLANRLFEPIFPECSLKPTRPAEPLAAERWLITAKNIPQEQELLAAGVGDLIAQGTPARDIAVLARTNQEAKDIAAALRTRGVRATVELPGLLATRECVVALAGLGVVADGWDAHAAATLLHHLEDAKPETPRWIIDRLQERREDPKGIPWASDALLTRLRAIQSTSFSPADALSAVINALDLPTHVARWGEPARRHAHLDALLHLARKYAEDARSARRAVTVPGLIAWLQRLEELELDTVPTPAGLDAVTVETYHRAKGLEWPVVVLASLKTPKEPDPWEPRAEGGAIDQDTPLKDRRIRYWPWPFASGGPFTQKTTATGLLDDSLATAEGQALIEKEHAESLRLLYVGFTRARSRVILAHRDAADSEKRREHYAWLDRIPDVDAALSGAFEDGTYGLGGGSNIRVRKLAAVPPLNAEQEAQAAWMINPKQESAGHVPRFIQPSSIEASENHPAPANVRVVTLPGSGALPAVRTDAVDKLGDAMHAYFATLPSTTALEAAAREAVAARCMEAHGVTGALAARDLVDAGERLRAWVGAEHPNATWLTEVPITAPLADSQGVGVIDMLLVAPDDSVVFVDHKSVGAASGSQEEAMRAFAPQVDAYSKMLIQRRILRGAYIHLPRGRVMLGVQ